MARFDAEGAAEHWPSSPGSHPISSGMLFSERYRVLEKIGAGGIGEVYKVEQVLVRRIFALKTLRQDYRTDEMAVERFAREARVGGRLRSEHTVAIVDSGIHDGIPYLVMEYLDGCALNDLLTQTGVLPVTRAVRLLLGACRGVSAAHALGVIHRDLKPSNLFVCPGFESETCKVLDFGVAKLASPGTESDAVATRTGALVGTLAYMPPEQIRGERELDVRADVYSLGAILYECLAGARLFQADSAHSLMYKILEQVPQRIDQLRQGLPQALVNAIHCAVAADKTRRFATVAELAAAIEPFAEIHHTEPERFDATLSDSAHVAPAPALAHYSLEPPRARKSWGWALGGAFGFGVGVLFTRLLASDAGFDAASASDAETVNSAGQSDESLTEAEARNGRAVIGEPGVAASATGPAASASAATAGDQGSVVPPERKNTPANQATAPRVPATPARKRSPSPTTEPTLDRDRSPPAARAPGDEAPSAKERVGF